MLILYICAWCLSVYRCYVWSLITCFTPRSVLAYSMCWYTIVPITNVDTRVVLSEYRCYVWSLVTCFMYVWTFITCLRRNLRERTLCVRSLYCALLVWRIMFVSVLRLYWYCGPVVSIAGMLGLFITVGWCGGVRWSYRGFNRVSKILLGAMVCSSFKLLSFLYSV